MNKLDWKEYIKFLVHTKIKERGLKTRHLTDKEMLSMMLEEACILLENNSEN